MKARDRHVGGRHTVAAKSRTADLFAESYGDTPADTGSAEVQPRRALQPIVRRVPPAPEPIDRPRAKQLWYAVVFPELMELPQPAYPAASMLQRLCLAAQQFTSLVSIEMPNALLLEIKGSVKLFGSLAVLHAGIDAAWSRLSMSARSAAAPTTLAALWLARAGKQVCIEDPGSLAGELADLPIACTSWDAE
ncbi:MAG: hypothetical protein JWN43_684, partial [Gammaproteobacteria bacterium]|nr:hypothetical protein [Gammaproteobacteria bacterium]